MRNEVKILQIVYILYELLLHLMQLLITFKMLYLPFESNTLV